jgi:membrane protein required for colicin V production
MNLLDGILIGILAFTLVRGFMRGLIREVAAVLGILAGAVVAGHLHPVLAGPLRSHFPSLPYADLTAYGLIFLATWLAFVLLGLVASRLARTLLLGWADRLLGAFVGLFKGTLASVVLITVLTLFLPSNSQVLRRSLLRPYLQSASSHLVQLVPAALERLYHQKQGGDSSEQHTPRTTRPTSR